MVKRLLGSLLLGLAVVGMLAGPAIATEGGGEFTEYSDIREGASDIGAEFLDPDAEESERPGFFDWFIFPLVVIGLLATGFILLRYLVFQPRFAQEAEERSKR